MTHAAGERPAGGFAHRWSTGYSASWLVVTASTACSFLVEGRVQERGGRAAGGLVTLLGPEGTGLDAPPCGGFSCLCLQARGLAVAWLVVVGLVCGPVWPPYRIALPVR